MTANKYDTLYENMKNRFTVVNNGSEYTLGDFMLMKASGKKSEKKSASSNLPVESTSKGGRAVAQIVSFVNDPACSVRYSNCADAVKRTHKEQSGKAHSPDHRYSICFVYGDRPCALGRALDNGHCWRNFAQRRTRFCLCGDVQQKTKERRFGSATLAEKSIS